MRRLTSVVLIITILPVLTWAIITRHDVKEEEYRKLAENYPSVCHFTDGSGTLIAEDWVVTAAHVAEYLKDQIDQGEEIQVMCGGNTYGIQLIVLHPRFRPVVDDIALVQLSKPVTDVQPVELYRGQHETGLEATFVGRGDFGTGLTGPEQRDGVNRAATNKVVAVDNRWVRFVFDAPDSPNTTPLEGISGPGDSGGPAYVDIAGTRFLIGVSSHQRGEGEGQGRYGVVEYYTRIGSYTDWLDSVME